MDGTGAVIGITTEALVGDPSVSVEDIAFAIPSERVARCSAGWGSCSRPLTLVSGRTTRGAGGSAA